MRKFITTSYLYFSSRATKEALFKVKSSFNFSDLASNSVYLSSMSCTRSMYLFSAAIDFTRKNSSSTGLLLDNSPSRTALLSPSLDDAGTVNFLWKGIDAPSTWLKVSLILLKYICTRIVIHRR